MDQLPAGSLLGFWRSIAPKFSKFVHLFGGGPENWWWWLKGQDGTIALRPVLSVAASDRKAFQKEGSKLREKYMVPTQAELNAYQTSANRSRLTSACSSMGNISRTQESQVVLNETSFNERGREESLSQIWPVTGIHWTHIHKSPIRLTTWLPLTVIWKYNIATKRFKSHSCNHVIYRYWLLSFVRWLRNDYVLYSRVMNYLCWMCGLG